jgi:hypothetical protein
VEHGVFGESLHRNLGHPRGLGPAFPVSLSVRLNFSFPHRVPINFSSSVRIVMTAIASRMLFRTLLCQRR